MPWSLQTVGSTIYYNINAVVPVVATLIAVLGNGTVAYTSDISGLSWSIVTGLPSNSGGGTFMYRANEIWFCGGGTWGNTSVSEPKIRRSTNLTSWSHCGTIGTNFVAYCAGYGYDSNQGTDIWMVGGGSNGGAKLSWILNSTFQNSTNSTAWSSSTNGTLIAYRVLCIFYEPINKFWVAGGYGTGTTMMWATQPSTGTWYGNGSNVVFTTVGQGGQCRGLGYGNNLWVAVGSSGAAGGNTIATGVYGSNPLISWTGRGASAISGVGNAVFYGKDDVNAGLWVAVGQQAGGGGVIVYSYNPTVSWTSVSNANTIFTTACYGISFSGGKWIATGAGGNTIARSFNGKNWEGIGANNPIIGTGQNSVYGS
jgi:hypothetical protein